LRTTASRSEGERIPVRRRPAGRAASCLPKEGFQARGPAPPISKRPAIQREPREDHLSMQSTPAGSPAAIAVDLCCRFRLISRPTRAAATAQNASSITLAFKQAENTGGAHHHTAGPGPSKTPTRTSGHRSTRVRARGADSVSPCGLCTRASASSTEPSMRASFRTIQPWA
jgi:hypothetical protein